MRNSRRAIIALPSNANTRAQVTQVSGPDEFTKPATPVKSEPYPVAAIIVDSPNATRSTNDVFGAAAEPDWVAIRRLGSRQGYLAQSIVAVNDGIPNYAVDRLRGLGFAVQFSHARDVDDRIVSQVVRMVDRANVFVIVSGDGGYCSLVTILQRLRKRVVVVAVERCCNRSLRRLADEFHPLPITARRVPKADPLIGETPVPAAPPTLVSAETFGVALDGRQQ